MCMYHLMTISRFHPCHKNLHTSANLSLKPPELLREVIVHFSTKPHTIRTGSIPFNMLHHVGLLSTTFWPPVSFPIPCNSEHHTTSPINPPPTNPFKHSLMPSLLHIFQQANPNGFPSSFMASISLTSWHSKGGRQMLLHVLFATLSDRSRLLHAPWLPSTWGSLARCSPDSKEGRGDSLMTHETAG